MEIFFIAMVLHGFRNPEIAEELVQETMLAAFNAKANYAGQASEQNWLIGILKHKIIDYFRKASKEKTQVSDMTITMVFLAAVITMHLCGGKKPVPSTESQ